MNDAPNTYERGKKNLSNTAKTIYITVKENHISYKLLKNEYNILS